MSPHAEPANRTPDLRAPEHPAPDTVATELAASLRSRGMRVTQQREQVLRAVRDLGHATPEQIDDAVPDADLATVYRTLELLEDLGFVRHTHLGHGAPSYRPAEDEHIHVVCHVCGSVTDAPADLVDELAARLRTAAGFTVDRAHFTVFGRCVNCGPDADASAAAGREQTTPPQRWSHHEH